MHRILKVITIFLLLLNLSIGVLVFLTQGVTPYASLIGAFFAAAGLSVLDSKGRSEED